MNLAIRVAHH